MEDIFKKLITSRKLEEEERGKRIDWEIIDVSNFRF